MTTRNEIETRLRQAFEVSPPEDGLRWLDQRVAQVAAGQTAISRRGVPNLRIFLRPLALVAAFVLLTGAVVAAMGLLERMVEESSIPGWRVAWDRGEILGIQQTDAGLTITLERAYADLNQVLVGFTVEGLGDASISDQGERAAIEWIAELRDPTGRTSDQWATSTLAMGLEETMLSAVVQTWLGTPAPVAGTWELTFTSVGYNSGTWSSGECTVGATDPACVNPPANAMVEGTWRFEFELPEPTGTVLSLDVSDTAGDATLHLTELRVTPSMIRYRIALDVGGNPVAWWGWPNPSVSNGSAAYITNSATHILTGDLTQGSGLEYSTSAGADAATGTWEIVIPELTYGLTNDEVIHVSGPWTLTVTVP
jgi:hypothetical protein